MKYIIRAAAVLTVSALMFSSSSCGEDEDRSFSIDSALQISAVVYNEDRDSFGWEVLELNEERIMLDVCGYDEKSGIDIVNLPIHVSYDGVCDIISENKDIQVSIGKNGGLWTDRRQFADQTYGFGCSIGNEGYAAILPYGSGEGEWNLVDEEAFTIYQNFDAYTGREYYLTVNACNTQGVPVIRAKLKLVQLEEPEDGKLTGKKIRPARGEESSHYSVELVEYEYSDMYKFMEE